MVRDSHCGYHLPVASRGVSTTLTSHAYAQIRRDILRGALRPGTPLRLAQLARELNVSMSVVREALTRLSEQGLVVAEPNQGFRAAALSRGDLVELTDLRVTLECLALERSIAKADVRWEAAIVASHHVLESIPTPDMTNGDDTGEEWSAAHEEFHDALGAGCQNRRLLTAVRSLRVGAEVYRQWSARFVAEEGRDIAAEHRQLMALATSRASAEASKALADHLWRTTHILLAHEAQLLAD